MPKYRITVINDQFVAEDEEDLPDSGAAANQAIKGALAVGVEQVMAGAPFYGAEVIGPDGSNRERVMVSVGVSALK